MTAYRRVYDSRHLTSRHKGPTSKETETEKDGMGM